MYSIFGQKKDYAYYKCRLKIFWIGGLISLLVTLAVVLWVALTPPQTGADFQLTPTDTHLIPFSRTFCDGSTLQIAEGSPYNNGSMFLTAEQPPLITGANSFNVSFSGALTNQTTSDTAGYYRSWFFQLHAGSTVTVYGCAIASSATFFLLQGTTNFDMWLASPGNEYAVLSLPIALCDGTMALITQYTTSNSDTYYFVLYAATAGVQVQVDMSFDRTQYSVLGMQGLPNCTLAPNETSCHLAVPLSTYQYVLVTFNGPSSAIGFYDQWAWSCSPRVWVYAAIVIGPTVFALVLPLVIILACMRYWKGKEDGWYRQVDREIPSNLVQEWVSDKPM